MLENRVQVDGSAYLAKTLFTDIRPLDEGRHTYFSRYA